MRYEPVYRAPLPTKIPGKHRWIATAAYRIHDIDVERAEDPDHQTFLDQENMIQLAIGCWDCEQVLGVIHAGSHCPADVQED